MGSKIQETKESLEKRGQSYWETLKKTGWITDPIKQEAKFKEIYTKHAEKAGNLAK